LVFWSKYSVWGNWANFEAYTRQITAFLPEPLSTSGAYFETVAETVLGI